MPSPADRPAAEISLTTIVANYQALQSLCPSAEVSAVVKADAYGHGAAQTASALFENGCRTFFVAYPHEGVDVREAVGDDADIYVFHGVSEQTLHDVAAAALRPVCNTLDDIKFWKTSQLNQGFALHFDTGMNRLGIRVEDVEAVKALCQDQMPALVMSHLAQADRSDSELNDKQLELFKSVAADFPSARKSLSSTGGIYLGDDYHFDLVRPGIGLYGGGPAYPPSIKLTPALTLTAPILSVFDLKAGDPVGYGSTFTARTDMTVATVALGYADGYLRSASNYGFGVLKGTPCPVLGRVSMDLTTIDVSDLETRPKTGDRIEFIGPKAGLEIQAEALGTLGYELTSRLGGRICKNWRTLGD